MLNKPASGYDIKIDFNQEARHFWSAELSQIYPALKRLEAKGLLEAETEISLAGEDLSGRSMTTCVFAWA